MRHVPRTALHTHPVSATRVETATFLCSIAISPGDSQVQKKRICVRNDRASRSVRWRTRAALSGAAVLLFSGNACAAAAAGCHRLMTDHLPIFETTLDVKASERTHRKLLLPANMDVLVLAREQGLDVRLEVKRDADVVAHADNPIFRTGTQRTAFRTVPDAQYSLEIVGKEHGAAKGRVEIRALALGRSAEVDRCVGINRALAAADSQFAAGQLVTLGITSDSATNAATAYKDSAEGYAAVAASLETAGPSAMLAEAQHTEAAALYWGVQDWEGSCMAAERAMRTYEAIGADYPAAKARALLGAALMETGPATKVTCGATPQFDSESRLERIRRLLASAAAFHGQRGEAYDQALALNDLGLTFTMGENFDEAMAAFEQARVLYERSRETLKQAQVLQNIAWANYGLGRLSEALPLYARALALMQPEQDPTLYAAILNNSALASTVAGDHDTALRQLGEALASSRTVQDKWWQVTILDNIGLVYDRIGEKDFALDFYGQSLALADTALISSGRRNTLSKMATILRDKGEYARALAARKEALALASSPSSRSIVSIYLSADYRAAGNFDEAATVLQAVLTASQSPPSDFARALALLERGHLASAQGALVQAESDYKEAIRIFHALDIPAREFDASLGLAQTLYRRASADEALRELVRTLQLAEELRQQSANPELRAKLLETSRPAFDLKISILADGYLSQTREPRKSQLALEALRTAEQARARALDDFTRLDMNAVGTSPQLLQQRQSIYAELSSRRQRLESLLETTTPTNPRVAVIRADVATLRQRLNDIDAQLAAASIRPAVADMPLTIDQQAIPNDVAVVEYWLGQQRALGWVVTREAIALSNLGDSASITDAALALHTALRSFGSVSLQERLKQAQRLHDAVFRPIQSQLLNKKVLTVVADGALHYVPFAVLQSHDKEDGRFVIQDHDLAVAPSIRTLFQQTPVDPHSSSQRMLLVADPVYGNDDSRLPAKDQGTKPVKTQKDGGILALLRGGADAGTLRRLPGTATEATAIRALFQKSEIDALEGPAATRARFLATDFSEYRFIHIASHAVADAEIPQLSALILSTVDQKGSPINGRVFAADLLNVRLNTELLVLSGCETALGKNVAGEGLIGLQYVMLARGARAVVSSLWAVPDRETAELMSRFYAGALRGGLSPRSALGDAMRSMIADKSDAGFWSAFTLTTSALRESSPTSSRAGIKTYRNSQRTGDQNEHQ
jgi:CHAT domain-containing protein